MIRAAGVIFTAPALGGRAVLFVKRGPDGDHAGEWCSPGGKIEEGEAPEQAAIRECEEEIGTSPPAPLELLTTVTNGDVEFTTFLCRLEEEFVVKLNEEHTQSAWVLPTRAELVLEGGLHPGLQDVLTRFAGVINPPTPDSELEAARSVVGGTLPSGYRYENMWLFDMRITGTGSAYRKSLNEYVYRPPEIWLTDETLARCNGLSIILLHPEGNVMDGNDFAERVVGTTLLPYIKGEEVWCVARIYDEATAKMMKKRQVSTSPGVFFKDTGVNKKFKLRDGSKLLVEGNPSLIDHLALCEQGVWDKGGEPAGVSATLITGGFTPMTDEEKAALEEAQSAQKDSEEQAFADRARKDAEAGEKLDKILTCLDALSSRVDAIENPPSGGESANTNADPEEGATETVADSDLPAALEAAKAETAAAKADAEQARKDSAEALRRIDALAKSMPKQRTDGDHVALTAAQAKADRVYQAFGDAAPRPLQGEDLLDYRRRLAGGLAKHSKDWKDVDLSGLPDNVLQIAEQRVYNDAMEAAHNPQDLEEGQLRAITTTDTTGRRITSFAGQPRSWMSSFAAPRRQLRGFKNRT